MAIDYGQATFDLLRQFKDNPSEIENIVKEYDELKSNLNLIEFRTIQSYLLLLKIITELIEELCKPKQAIIVLAAAVSDFYIKNPTGKIRRNKNIRMFFFLFYKMFDVEHKIQSGSNLSLNFDPVPKLLGHVNRIWCRNQCIVTFKLETVKIIYLFFVCILKWFFNFCFFFIRK